MKEKKDFLNLFEKSPGTSENPGSVVDQYFKGNPNCTKGYRKWCFIQRMILTEIESPFCVFLNTRSFFDRKDKQAYQSTVEEYYQYLQMFKGLLEKIS